MVFRLTKIISQICAIVFGAIAVINLLLSPLSSVAFWGFTWGQVIGVVFVLSVFWAIIQLNVEVSRLQNKKPKLKVTVPGWIGNPDNFCINVENVGEVGIIQAYIEIIEGEQFAQYNIRDYYAYWKNGKGIETEILKGRADRVLIARINSNPPNHDIQHFTLYFYDTNSDRKACAASCSWGLPETIEPEFTLKVSISSKPSLREGAVSHYYKLTPSRGLFEIEKPHNLVNTPDMIT